MSSAAQKAGAALKPHSSKRRTAAVPEPFRASSSVFRSWHYIVALAAVFGITFQVYGPALRGPFLFDDVSLPFASPTSASQPLLAWIAGVRPLLMLSYWLNFQLSGFETFSYHACNVILHTFNAGLVFLILRRLLTFSGTDGRRRELLAGFGAALFLLHPLQTESVAYIAGRSESLSALFLLAAFAVFLYRPQTAITWPVAGAVLVLFGAAAMTKEHTVVLPALLLLTDYFWNPGFTLEGVRRNWRLYIPILAGGAAGVLVVWKVLLASKSAGFALKDLTWYQYFFTECRAIFVYLRLFFDPAGQTIEYDPAISRSVLDHGAIWGLLGLIGLISAAYFFRRRFPLGCYGALLFLLFLAPTSSFVPLKDPIAEHRLYLPAFGLLLVVIEALRRLRMEIPTLVAGLSIIVLAAGILSYWRAQVWSSNMALWEDTVGKAPAKARPHVHLAYAYYRQNRCQDALGQVEAAARIEPPDYTLLLDWGLIAICLQRTDEAAQKLEQAIALKPAAQAYSLLGMVYGRQGRAQEALQALDKAEKVDPYWEMTYVYRGHWRLAANQIAEAAEDYRRALNLNPRNQTARDGLNMAETRLRELREARPDGN